MLYDSHTHLNSPELFAKHEEYIKNFLAKWWQKLVNVWVDEERTLRGIQIQEKFPKICYSSVWFHPSEAVFNENFRKNSDKYFAKIEKFIQDCADQKSVIAIGECGLDYHYQVDELAKKLQKELFIRQCDLALKNDLPVIIHSRDAFEDSVEILKNYKNLKINFHCWWYGPSEIEQVQRIFPNLRIGFDGNITYKKAQELRDSAKIANIQNILIETDAPYLSPQIVRKETNQPANIDYTYDFIAELKNIKRKDLEIQIEKNFKSLFQI